jgi:leader peptidase (prepilin peptidase)/N-methyltransferase
MVVLCVIDLNHRILPNAITLPGVLLGLVASVFLEPGWRDSLIGVVAGGGVLWLVGEIYFWLRGEEGMGMGDVKMLAMVGAFLGWQGMLVTLLLASLGGSLVGGLLIASRRGNLKYALPFGSFLAVAALLTTHVGRGLIAWYLGLY